MSYPEVIYDRATGVAADTVAKHAEPQPLVFYAGWFCPYVQRNWIALEEKGVPYQYKEVNPYKKDPHFLAVNPKGLVPSAEVNGKALYESLVINEFFEDFFPDTPKLLPEDPVERARARIWIDYISKTVVPAFRQLVLAQDPAEQSKALSNYYEALKPFIEQIAPGGPYFLGAKFSLVDATIAPWVVRDFIHTKYRGYERSAAGEAWEKYSQAIETRDSIVNTSSDKEYYKQIYAKYLQD
ncbi:glutathione S-transferase [Exidia glandulosa HHB12029]|uniref:Glutathione S-transferase n=1 Tax=Exidia glandulosa HHB12029 TaxID=1314781 RepID=A0A165DNN3_EXIGL|nr:glutathione S-transferase [Exidia glandulosa HHB12029]